MKVRSILSVGLLFLVACSDDEEPAPTDGSMDASFALDASTDGASDGSDLDARSAALCRKYGAREIEEAVKNEVLLEIGTDCNINAHFYALRADLLARFTDCLALQAQELFGCPGVKYVGGMSANGLRCAERAGTLDFSEGDYGALLVDIVAGLGAAGIANGDIAMVAAGLGTIEGIAITQTSAGFTRSTCADAGPIDAGSSDAFTPREPDAS